MAEAIEIDIVVDNSDADRKLTETAAAVNRLATRSKEMQRVFQEAGRSQYLEQFDAKQRATAQSMAPLETALARQGRSFGTLRQTGLQLAQGFSQMVPGIGGVAAAFGGMTAALGPVGIAIAGISTLIPALINLFDDTETQMRRVEVQAKETAKAL